MIDGECQSPTPKYEFKSKYSRNPQYNKVSDYLKELNKEEDDLE